MDQKMLHLVSCNELNIYKFVNRETRACINYSRLWVCHVKMEPMSGLWGSVWAPKASREDPVGVLINSKLVSGPLALKEMEPGFLERGLNSARRVYTKALLRTRTHIRKFSGIALDRMCVIKTFSLKCTHTLMVMMLPQRKDEKNIYMRLPNNTSSSL